MRQGTTAVASALLWSMALAYSPCCAGAEGTTSLPDSRLGVRTAPLLLLSRHDVQADLQLSRTQVDDAETAIRELYVKANGLRGLKGEKAITERRAIDEEQRLWFENRLSETQRKRIVQIDLQWEGPSALISRPAVAEFLELTPEQLTTLKKAVDESIRRRSQDSNASHFDRELAQRTLATLTDAQKLRWKAMLGQPFQPQLAHADGKTTK
ncbi:hypothetical protein SAMN05444166_7167 [Singulisphaera sp. GP187]|uniref:hypothetical protein n=1 Tax=Singulisphaera sp. GP187 TaxID=1882752 RepID=UPI0009288D9E|nr:hypothetical protein [Singulisphaera sp. GP187]SIO62847.1 hypothetical protein SAMN05444166_7167 [Singulisphaera sp. GP187]